MSDKIYDVLMDIKQGIGRLEKQAENADNHINHVSRKVDIVRSELNDHRDDAGAHGAGGAERANKNWVLYMGLLFAGVEFVIHLAPVIATGK